MSECFLTEKRGKRMLEALTIMQELGIDFITSNYKAEILNHSDVYNTL